MSKDVKITKAEEQKDWKDKALAYLKDSGEQIIKGNFTDKVTLGGTVGEVLLGVVGVDLPMDIRDLVYDVTHLKCSWKCVGMLAIDVVALIPVIGAIKYSDEVVKLGKRWMKNIDSKVEVTADAVSGAVKKAKEIFDSGAKKAQTLMANAETAIAKPSDKISKGTKKAKEILDDLSNKLFKEKNPPKMTMEEIDKLIAEIGTSIKNHPLRQEYENAVKDLSKLEEELRNIGLKENLIAQAMHQARRDLGIKYKNLTPDALREYIYEINKKRYDGDPLGGSFEFFVNKYMGDFNKIIEAAKRPNGDVDKLLKNFKEWLIEKNK
jgi:hypothetical protein